VKPFRSEALRHLKRLPEKNGSSDIAAFSTTHGDERKATTSIVPESMSTGATIISWICKMSNLSQVANMRLFQLVPSACTLLVIFSPLHAGDKESRGQKPAAPIVIPVTATGPSTTTKLGNSYITRSPGGQSFTTSQLGSSTVTRDSQGNTWTTSKVGNSYVTRGSNGQQQTTTKLGNSFVTRDSKTGSTLTTSPLGNTFQTRSNSGSSWSTSQLGSSLITRSGQTSEKRDGKAAQVIVIPTAR